MPIRTFLNAKLHRATITDANVEYQGSLGIDAELMAAAGILPNEQIDIYNIDNGERLTTYAIPAGPGEICLNGAAARKGAVGQRVIIATYAQLTPDEIPTHQPTVLLLGPGNTVLS